MEREKRERVVLILFHQRAISCSCCNGGNFVGSQFVAVGGPFLKSQSIAEPGHMHSINIICRHSHGQAAMIIIRLLTQRKKGAT